MIELRLTPTERFFMTGDVMVRLWQGTTEHDTPVLALIAGVQIGSTNPAFAETLVPIPSPTADDAQRWARSVLERAGGSGGGGGGE